MAEGGRRDAKERGLARKMANDNVNGGIRKSHDHRGARRLGTTVERGVVQRKRFKGTRRTGARSPYTKGWLLGGLKLERGGRIYFIMLLRAIASRCISRPLKLSTHCLHIDQRRRSTADPCTYGRQEETAQTPGSKRRAVRKQAKRNEVCEDQMSAKGRAGGVRRGEQSQGKGDRLESKG